jgi:predicted amidophosphoribosyltransferase
VFLYAGPARAALIRLKFSGWRSSASILAPGLAVAARSAPIRTIRPTVTWVPLGRRRKRARGFDQAEALAMALGAEMGWPVERLLTRAAETSPQARRGGLARRKALAGAFVAVATPPPFVVLVDDVLTTGATAAACAEALTHAGARHVGLLTVARALGGRVPIHGVRSGQPDIATDRYE